MNFAILLFAGSSTRFKNRVPKQFYLVKNKPIYSISLEVLNSNKNIDGIIAITNSDKVMDVYNYIKKNKFEKVKCVISGGTTRSESVKLGLNKLQELGAKDDDIVLLHDAVRPLLDEYIISNAIKETIKKDATTYALRSYDTIVKSYPNYQIKEYLKREEIFRVQTPQTFKYGIILNAYNKINKATNDDTELVHLLNKKVHLLKGNEKLFKITNFDDIKKLESYLK